MAQAQQDAVVDAVYSLCEAAAEATSGTPEIFGKALKDMQNDGSAWQQLPTPPSRLPCIDYFVKRGDARRLLCAMSVQKRTTLAFATTAVVLNKYAKQSHKWLVEDLILQLGLLNRLLSADLCQHSSDDLIRECWKLVQGVQRQIRKLWNPFKCKGPQKALLETLKGKLDAAEQRLSGSLSSAEKRRLTVLKSIAKLTRVLRPKLQGEKDPVEAGKNALRQLLPDAEIVEQAKTIFESTGKLFQATADMFGSGIGEVEQVLSAFGNLEYVGVAFSIVVVFIQRMKAKQEVKRDVKRLCGLMKRLAPICLKPTQKPLIDVMDQLVTAIEQGADVCEKLHRTARVRKINTQRSELAQFEKSLNDAIRVFNLDVLSYMQRGLSPPWEASPAFSTTVHPVKLEDRAEEVDRALKTSAQSGGPRCVVLVGMGGVGKTAVAEHCYQKAKRKIPKITSSYVTLHHDVLNAQNRLATTLSGTMEGLADHVQAGQRILELLTEQPRFIVLDNLQNAKEVDKFFPSPGLDWGGLASDNQILVTTRREEVYQNLKTRFRQCERIELKSLCLEDAKELLCQHALGPHPDLKQIPPGQETSLGEAAQHLKTYDQLLEEIALACGCLPLALVVTGSRLFHHKGEWASISGRLRKAASLGGEEDDPVFHCLRVTIDSLDAETQSAFLEAAIILPGIDMRDARKVLGSANINNLWDHKLIQYEIQDEIVEVDDPDEKVVYPFLMQRKRLGVHGLLVALAVKICKEDRNPVTASSHLSGAPASKAYSDGKAHPEVTAITIQTDMHKDHNEVREVMYQDVLSRFPKLQKLRVLGESNQFNTRVGNPSSYTLVGDPNGDEQALSYVEIADRSLYCDPGLRIQLQKLGGLQVINISGCSVKFEELKLWDLPQLHTIFAESLLQLTTVQKAAFSGFHELTTLQRLELNGCANLVQICEQALPPSLRRLGLAGCVKLTSIPDGIWANKQLTLDIRACSQLAKPTWLNLSSELLRCSAPEETAGFSLDD